MWQQKGNAADSPATPMRSSTASTVNTTQPTRSRIWKQPSNRGYKTRLPYSESCSRGRSRSRPASKTSRNPLRPSMRSEQRQPDFQDYSASTNFSAAAAGTLLKLSQPPFPKWLRNWAFSITKQALKEMADELTSPDVTVRTPQKT